MKLHAVAPGGPPEGQCQRKQEMVSNTKTQSSDLGVNVREDGQVGQLYESNYVCGTARRRVGSDYH